MGNIAYKMNEVQSINTLKFSAASKDFNYVTAISIEDKYGDINLTLDSTNTKVTSNINSINFNRKTNEFSIGENKIPLNSRTRPSYSGLNINIETSKLIAKVKDQEGMEYSWSIVDATDAREIYKSEFKSDGNFEYIANNKGMYLLELFVKEIKYNQIKSSFVYTFNYEDSLNEIKNETDKYPFLNFEYLGHNKENIGNNRYIFTIDYNYSLPIKVIWYVYRNGGNYYTRSTNEPYLEIDFNNEQDGEYTVMYYLIKNKETQFLFYNFESITVPSKTK